MSTLIYAALNVALVGVFIYIMKKKNYLSFLEGGRWWLTWFAVGIITLMDEVTSVYYAPFEAYRFIGIKAIIYIALTSLLIRFLSTRMVEISEILEANNIKGGGVYSFSYLVLGPSVSFIAISSILVDYVLTATISTVSAVQNGTAFINMGPAAKFFIDFGVVWSIAGLNILGIKENARFTFYIFLLATFVLLNLITGGIINLDSHSLHKIAESATEFWRDVSEHSIFGAYSNIIIGIGSCILAYSGVESVLQTASLTKSWHDTRKSYIFLAVTVGIVTPLIALFALSSKVDINKHETDLIPQFAQSIMGSLFGIAVAILACITLIMAVNTAMVASSELIEKVVEKYGYHWLIKLNKRQSYYRIHILNALFYSFILTITSGSQAVLAEMYAVGLVASFCINIFSILVYRYSKGTKEITYHTSRGGTAILFAILFSTFIYIIVHRPYGTLLWFILASVFVIFGLRIAKKRAPEIPVIKLTDNPMDVIFAIMEMDSNEVHLIFKRFHEEKEEILGKKNIYVSFYKPRIETPEKLGPNHFWLQVPQRAEMFGMIEALLAIVEYEVPEDIKIHVHFGWPLSSWYDRLSTGVLVYKIIRLPHQFPRYIYHMDYDKRPEESQKLKG